MISGFFCEYFLSLRYFICVRILRNMVSLLYIMMMMMMVSACCEKEVSLLLLCAGRVRERL